MLFYVHVFGEPTVRQLYGLGYGTELIAELFEELGCRPIQGSIQRVDWDDPIPFRVTRIHGVQYE